MRKVDENDVEMRVPGKDSNKGVTSLEESSDDRENTSCMATLRSYPKYITFIVSIEFCERFSYFGMRSVLLLYLGNYLHWDDDTATSVYHAFTVLAYFFPVAGGIIADSYWGRYKTIIVLSVVYVSGHVLTTIGSVPYLPTQAAPALLSMTGLLLIAIGTGGIKSCVSPFGGDQFVPEQSHLRKQFFAIFYFAITAGSLISTFITPIFRADVNCYPNEADHKFDECFALAFGVPGALMVIALIMFVAGSKWYTFYPPEGSVFVHMCKCIYSAIKTRWSTPKNMRKEKHWIDYADDTDKMKRDTKYVLQILVLFIPIPAFWALFDQQGSRWTLQAIQLDGNIGSINLKPDQLKIINPLLILILIPLFEFTLYPLLRRMNINFSALRKMSAGFLFNGISFIFAALLQIHIGKGLTVLPTSSEFGVRAINTQSCAINVSINNRFHEIPSFHASDIQMFGRGASIDYSYISCDGTTISRSVSGINQEEVADLFITQDDVTMKDMGRHKTEGGGGRFTIINLSKTGRPLTYEVVHTDIRTEVLNWEDKSVNLDVPWGKATVYISNNSTRLYEYDLDIEVGAVYTMVADDTAEDSFHVQDLKPNLINVAWIFPQFVIISVGEVFLSITGLEFSYSQAPPSMKSVLAAMWFFTGSVGNIIVLIVAEARGIEKQSNEYFLFAGIIFVAGIAFMLLANRYELVDEDEFAAELKEDEEKDRRRSQQYSRGPFRKEKAPQQQQEVDANCYKNNVQL